MVKSYVWCWTQQKTIHDDPHGYSKTIYPAVCRTHGKRPCSKRRSKKARHRSRHGFWKWLEVGKPLFFLDKKGIDDLTSQTFGIWQQQLAFHPTKKSGLLQTTDDCHRTSRFVFSTRKKKPRGFAHCCDKSLAATWGVDFSPFMAQRRRCTKIERKLSEV